MTIKNYIVITLICLITGGASIFVDQKLETRKLERAVLDTRIKHTTSVINYLKRNKNTTSTLIKETKLIFDNGFDSAAISDCKIEIE